MDIEFKSPVKSLSFDQAIVAPKLVSSNGSGLLVTLRVKGSEAEVLGLALGEINVAMGWRQEGETVRVTAHMAQPAFFVPVLGQIVYGHECKWRVVVSGEDIAGIDEPGLCQWTELAKAQIARGVPSGEVVGAEVVEDAEAAE